MASIDTNAAIAPFSYSTISEINDKLESQCIVVRLLRMWEARDFKRNNVLVSVNCLLVDEKNTSIQASIHPRRLHKFRNKLKEGNIFSITTFDVTPHLNGYRLTDHPYKIYFNDNTSVEDVNDAQYAIPFEYFRIRTFQDVQMMVDKGEHLPDVIGQVSCIRTSKKMDETKIPPKTTLNLILTCILDSGETANISLWDKHALEIKEKVLQLKEAPLLVIVTGVNPKTVGSHIYLNATGSTRFFFNLDNLITQDFCKSTFYQKDLLPTIVEVNGESTPSDIQSIGQVLAFVNSQGGTPKMFWCKAKVIDIILSGGWYYIACAGCSTKMTMIGGKITCQACPPAKAIGVLKYRIEVIVEDDNDTSTFVIFEKAAEKLLKTTASDLAANNDITKNNDSAEIVPQAIQDIVGKDYIFYIKVANYNFTAKHQSFSVYEIALPSSVVTKKRSETCETRETNSTKLHIAAQTNAKLGMKSNSECHKTKKPRTNSRKNKAQVVLEEPEESEE